ncbi:hypothetical protein [Azospirillum sp. TSO22-1]|uniref:hypothetical protein n=1 Tax=Azospirillum sp. TSO22-1 TaxID=716789 RepID=UPI000D60A6D2|nr:hypothetical protein [Azospirillum sp. TSO22-1]PWC37167.1 hypothetical protein TSO221_27940 [Azospirillum sp. TSO22-1]
MLREVWEYLTTPASPLARRLGYVTQAVALGARHRRQRHAWAPHVAEARRFTLEAVGNGGRLLVAGSGRLIEVPLAELAERFGEVVLADLVHPRAARQQARRFGNVTLVEADLSGALAGVLAGEPAVGTPPDLGWFDAAVSCNLLSQLPLLPMEALERRGVAEAERTAFARALVEGHVAWLRTSAPVAALFTDVETEWVENGHVVARADSLWGAALPPPDLGWVWDVAPHGEQERRRDLRHRVAAWRNLNAGGGAG